MAGRGLFVTALALVSLSVAPRELQAQVTPTPAAAAPAAAAGPVDPKLVEFAKLHATMNTARDDSLPPCSWVH